MTIAASTLQAALLIPTFHGLHEEKEISSSSSDDDDDDE